MKMLNMGLKSIGGLAVVFTAYIDKTFSPLFWILLALIFVDMVLNIHKEGQQFAKIGSAAMSMGIPTIIAQNVGVPDLGKYLVAMMCLIYLQVVVPQFVATLSKLSFSKDKATQAVDAELLQAVVEQVAQKFSQDAQAVVDSAKLAGTPGSITGQESAPVIQGTPSGGQ